MNRSGAANASWTLKGHASVFNQPCDFGPFTEFVAPGAFAGVLKDPNLEVMANWQHDDRWVLGSTMNGTLDLSEDGAGLHVWARPPLTTTAEEARTLIEGGYVQQMSFKFRIGAETWEVRNEGEEDELLTVTITEVSHLWDVTICGLGAYSQTDVGVASRARLDRAIRAGRVQRKRRTPASNGAAKRRRETELARLQLPAPRRPDTEADLALAQARMARIDAAYFGASRPDGSFY